MPITKSRFLSLSADLSMYLFITLYKTGMRKIKNKHNIDATNQKLEGMNRKGMPDAKKKLPRVIRLNNQNAWCKQCNI